MIKRNCREAGLRRSLSVALLIVAAVGVMWSLESPVAAQEGTPAPQPEIDGCLVAVGAENPEVRVGESMHLWIWGVGVEPDSWDLKVDGHGSLILQGAREIDPRAQFVEWTVAGEKAGEITISVDMVCEKPGHGADSLTLMVLPGAPDSISSPASQPAIGDCTTHLSISDQAVLVGDQVHAWFVGVETEERSWTLAMEGDGSAQVVGTRELDPEYVEWKMEAMAAGIIRLTATMDCRKGGVGVSSREILVADHDDKSDPSQVQQAGSGSAGHGGGSWGTAAIVQVGLMAGLLAVLAVLVYVLVRRR
ncbi:MAG: hypothetical protein OXE87_09500 [Chloroflexi bacterium]|nr:hypothetical protein [Chloroflexota bacterium]